MNGVLGALHDLKGELPKNSRERLFDEAIRSGSTLSQLLGDIVAFSEIESGRFNINRAPTNLAELVEAVTGLLRDQARVKDLTLRVDCPDVGWLSIDPARVRQILFHLVGNALKFTDQGGVEVRATISGAGGGQRLRLEVQDTGVGITAAEQKNVFERFRQIEDSNTRRFNGAGLGLAISRAVARLMGGDVDFVSQEGLGSTFWCEIAAPACAPIAGPRADAGEWLAGMQILLVEDNPTNQLVATHLLTQLGAQVTTALNGSRGRRSGVAPGLRPDLHGHPDAGHGRHRGHPPHPRVERAVSRRADRGPHRQRPQPPDRGLPRGGHGRLCPQANLTRRPDGRNLPRRQRPHPSDHRGLRGGSSEAAPFNRRSRGRPTSGLRVRSHTLRPRRPARGVRP